MRSAGAERQLAELLERRIALENELAGVNKEAQALEDNGNGRKISKLQEEEAVMEQDVEVINLWFYICSSENACLVICGL